METLTLVCVLIAVLMLIILAGMYFGYHELNSLISQVKRNSMDIKALQNRPTYVSAPPQAIFHTFPPSSSGGGGNDDEVFQEVTDAYENDDILVEDASDDEAPYVEPNSADLDEPEDDEDVATAVAEGTVAAEGAVAENVVAGGAVAEETVAAAGTVAEGAVAAAGTVAEGAVAEGVVAAAGTVAEGAVAGGTVAEGAVAGGTVAEANVEGGAVEGAVEDGAVEGGGAFEINFDGASNGGHKKETPDEPAKNYDEGYETVSPHNNETYVVKADKNGKKRWTKKRV